MPKYFEVSGPTAIVLSVRDTATAAEFYEKLLGFQRDPEVFPNGGVGFLTKPSSFAVIQAPPGVDLESLPVRFVRPPSGSRRLTVRWPTMP